MAVSRYYVLHEAIDINRPDPECHCWQVSHTHTHTLLHNNKLCILYNQQCVTTRGSGEGTVKSFAGRGGDGKRYCRKGEGKGRESLARGGDGK